MIQSSACNRAGAEGLKQPPPPPRKLPPSLMEKQEIRLGPGEFHLHAGTCIDTSPSPASPVFDQQRRPHLRHPLLARQDPFRNHPANLRRFPEHKMTFRLGETAELRPAQEAPLRA